MSAPGQQDPALEQGQTADTPDGTGTQDTQANWEERYKEAQGWGTRLAQEKAQLETEAQLARALRSEDPAERQQALQQLGLALVPDETDDELTAGQVYDNDPAVLKQLQELQAWRQQQEQTAQQQTAAQTEQANYQAYRGITDPQLKQMGVPDTYHEVIAGLALELPEIHTPQGPKPDLEGAWKQYLDYSEGLFDVPDVRSRVLQKYGKTKPRTALITQNGQAGTEVPDLTTHDGRVANAMARFNAER